MHGRSKLARWLVSPPILAIRSGASDQPETGPRTRKDTPGACCYAAGPSLRVTRLWRAASQRVTLFEALSQGWRRALPKLRSHRPRRHPPLGFAGCGRPGGRWRQSAAGPSAPTALPIPRGCRPRPCPGALPLNPAGGSPPGPMLRPSTRGAALSRRRLWRAAIVLRATGKTHRPKKAPGRAATTNESGNPQADPKRRTES